MQAERDLGKEITSNKTSFNMRPMSLRMHATQAEGRQGPYATGASHRETRTPSVRSSARRMTSWSRPS